VLDVKYLTRVSKGSNDVLMVCRAIIVALGKDYRALEMIERFG